MRSFALSSLIVILLCTACVSIRPVGITRAGGTSLECPGNGSTLSSPFRDKVFRGIFRCSLDVKGHHLTGLLFLKRMPDSSMRVAFTNEFGMTWFDFILKNDRFTVAYCFEPMNKKALHRIFKTNFELLFSAGTDLSASKIFSSKQPGQMIVRSRFRKYRTWYTLDTPSCRVDRISGKSGLIDKTLISFSGYHDGVPDSVVVATPVIRMVMNLERER